MTDNFDLAKYIKDNKVIEKSNKYLAAALNEEEIVKEKKEEKVEKIEENVDLKSKIKEMVLAELSEDVELEEDESISEEAVTEKKLGKKGKEFYKGIKKADSYMKEDVVTEIEKDESEDNVEAEEEVEVVDAEDTPVETDTPTDTGGIMGNLEAAIEKARELGDEKLIDQIGNTITFYTRQYISK